MPGAALFCSPQPAATAQLTWLRELVPALAHAIHQGLDRVIVQVAQRHTMHSMLCLIHLQQQRHCVVSSGLQRRHTTRLLHWQQCPLHGSMGSYVMKHLATVQTPVRDNSMRSHAEATPAMQCSGLQ